MSPDRTVLFCLAYQKAKLGAPSTSISGDSFHHMTQRPTKPTKLIVSPGFPTNWRNGLFSWNRL
jgi:hypothetical protein